MGMWSQDTVKAGTFWGVFNVSLCASGDFWCLPGGSQLTGGGGRTGINKNVTDAFSFLKTGHK